MQASMKQLLTPVDFTNCPIWRYDEDLEGYFEVRSLEDAGLATGTFDLQMLAEFTTLNGERFRGKLVGVADIYSIGLFARNEIVGVNKNMRKDSKEQAAKFLELSGLADRMSVDDLFPLRYESRWGDGTFVDFSGVFEKPDWN